MGVPRHPTFYTAEEGRAGWVPGATALPGRPQAPAPAGAALLPAAESRGCGKGNSGRFLVLTYPKPPHLPPPQIGGRVAVGPGRPRGPAQCSAPLRGAGPRHVPPLMDPICARVRAPNTPIALSVCVGISAAPCGLACGAGSGEAPPPRPAALHRLGALPSPGAAPGKRPRPVAPLSGGDRHRESKETSLGVRQLLPGCPGGVCVPAPPRHVRLFSVPEKHYRIVTSSHTIIP